MLIKNDVTVLYFKAKAIKSVLDINDLKGGVSSDFKKNIEKIFNKYKEILDLHKLETYIEIRPTTHNTNSPLPSSINLEYSDARILINEIIYTLRILDNKLN